MKIYAYTYISNDAKTLSEYSGKDVWIKCVDLKYHNDTYIRIGACLGYFGDDYSNMYNINELSVDELQELTTNPPVPEEIMYQLTTSYTRNLNNFEIVQPMETCTTKDLYPDYIDNSSQLDRYIGKDLWVLASQPGAYTYYIKPISRDGLSLTLSELPVERIDNTWGHDGTSIEQILESMKKVHTDFADSWVLNDPLEVMTTDELLDILEENYANEEDEEE